MSAGVSTLIRAFELADKRADDATARLQESNAAIARVRRLHTPIAGDEFAAQRCSGCIAGYDPKTGDLVHCAWPCPTIQALAGGTDEH